MKVKKLISLMATFAMVFSLVACGSKDSEENTVADKSKEKESVKQVEQVDAVIYSYDLDKGELLDKTIKIDEKDEKVIFSEFTKSSPAVKNAKLNSMEIKKYEDNRTAYVDVTSDFVNKDLSDKEEKLLLNAFTLTFMKNFDVVQVSLSVDGKAYQSDYLYIGPTDFLNDRIPVTNYEIVEDEPEEEKEEAIDPGPGDPGDTEDYYYDDEIGCGDET